MVCRVQHIIFAKSQENYKSHNSRVGSSHLVSGGLNLGSANFYLLVL